MRVYFALAFIIFLFSTACQKNGIVVKSVSITSLSPDSGSYGTVVTIIGRNLESPDSIKLNGKPCPIKNANGDTITITVPKAAGSGPIAVYFRDSTFTWPYFHFRYSNYVTTVAYCKNISNANSAGPEAGFIWPYGVATDTSGNIYIAGMSYTPYIRKLDTNGIFTSIAGDGKVGFSQGPANTAEFGMNQYEIARDRLGNIAVYDHDRFEIRKIGADGTVSTYAGNGSLGQVNGPAGQSTIGLNGQGLAFNGKGELFFSDESYIRKVTTDGMVSNYIGNGFTYSGSITPAPQEADTSTWLYVARALCFDRYGNLYFGDGPYIRKATPDGKVFTLAGSVENGIAGIAVDDDGNIYVSEASNRIRKLGTDGMVTTFAGSHGGFTDGPTEKALFDGPGGIAFDKNGDLIVADKNNYRIRKIVIQ